MESTVISTEELKRSARDARGLLTEALAAETRFDDLPLPARALLAITRIRRSSDELSIAERYVLDTLGRIVDAGPERAETIAAVNKFAELLSKPQPFAALSAGQGVGDSQWLTTVENLALCVLCQIRAGQLGKANSLVSQWLNDSSVGQFNAAAKVLCQTECVKHGGDHVFSPSWKKSISDTVLPRQRSVFRTSELSLGESVLLNAFRLRARTLHYPKIATKVVPLLGQNLALLRLEAIIDGYLVEVLRSTTDRSAFKCTCCKAISPIEARLLNSVAAHASGDAGLLEQTLSDWLPVSGVEQLMKRHEDFQEIAQSLGTALPMREWAWSELESLCSAGHECSHAQEPSMLA